MVIPCNSLEGYGRIFNSTRKDADMIHRPAKGHDAVSAYPAVLRFKANDAVKGGGS
jgi:hypothetical protein